MAIYHLTAKTVSRGKGQSILAAAAYRSGQQLTDEQTGEIKHYKARAERIQFEGVFAPANAPDWAKDRQQLWNHVERAERRKDAQLARELEIALPHELTDTQREWLVKDFVREQFVRKGYAVDVAIHAPEKDHDARNYHAHLLVTLRTLDGDGFAKTKDRSQNSKAQLQEWREEWARLANRHLERHGHEARIDHRSLAEQGEEREPTIHLGYAASAMGERGAQSDRVDMLREIMARNDAIRLDREAPEEERDQPKSRAGSDPDLDWTSRGGMAAQQKSALEWAAKARERAADQQPLENQKTGLDRFRYRDGKEAQKPSFEPEKTDAKTEKGGLDRFRYRGDTDRDRDDGGGRDR